MLFDNTRRAVFLVVLFSLSCLASKAQIPGVHAGGDASGQLLARAYARWELKENEKKLRLNIEELVRLTADLRDRPSVDAKRKLNRVEKLAKSIRFIIVDGDNGTVCNIHQDGCPRQRWGQR